MDGGWEAGEAVEHLAFDMAFLKSARTFEEEMKRFLVINNNLYNNGWESYERLPVATVVIRHEGNIEVLWNDLAEAFSMMVNDGHEKGYGSWLEAANIIRLPGRTLRKKYERFEELQKELGKREWEYRSTTTGQIALSLARRDGDPADLAEAFRQMEQAIINEGYEDCVESGQAAITMFDMMPGSRKERALKFADSLDALGEKGWSKKTHRYPTAAMIATFPGTIGENVSLLHDTCVQLNGGQLGKDDYYHTDLAIALMEESYK